jgi:hypothetical protein
LGVAAALVGLLLGLPARPVLAADPQLTLVVTQRWQLAGTQGTWTPYVVTVRNDGATGFAGDVYLVPNQSRSVTTNTFPSYRSAISVNRGSQRSAVFYVIDSPGGYAAELRDGTGHALLRSDLSTEPLKSASALGILSDLNQAEQKIAAPLRGLSRVDSSLSRFASPVDFPTSAVFLSGLSALVVDEFDSAALSQAQVQALKDFVGLGGTLIEAGGPSWRRTLLSLPPELLPMRPSATSTAALGPLAELAGGTTDATAQVASGAVVSGRATLVTQDGQPLVVEGAYGAGRVIELAFDPFAEPFDTQVYLAGAAWSHAINRALSGVQGGSRSAVSTGFGTSSPVAPPGGVAAGPGSWAPGYGTGNEQLNSVLQDTPAAGAPPVGLLGGLLVAYVLLAGLLNYLFLTAAGRRTMMWVSVPLIAVVFTGGAYLVGFGTRGADFLVTEVQLQRLAPEGAVQSYTFDGVYPPRKGDVTLTLPGSTLVSTAVAAGPFADGRGDALITTGQRPEVLLANVAVWSPRLVQTLSVSHPYAYEPRLSMPVDVRLKVEKGHAVGSVQNLSSRPVTGLLLVNSSLTELPLATTLAPGATVGVNVDLGTAAGGGSAAVKVPVRPVPGVSESSREAMVRLAANQALSGRPGELAVVGFTQAIDSIRVDGAQPGRSAVAALVEPVQIQGADSLAGIAPRPRLVSNFFAADSAQVDIYDFDLPSGLTSTIGLGYQLLDSSSSSVRSIEVYDWSAGTWRAMPKQQVPARGTAPAALTAGEVRPGIVRVRVVEASPGQASLTVGDQAP